MVVTTGAFGFLGLTEVKNDADKVNFLVEASNGVLYLKKAAMIHLTASLPISKMLGFDCVGGNHL